MSTITNPDIYISFTERSLGAQTITTINARDLHEFLGVETHFADWITRRIEDYGFIDGTDYTLLKNELSTYGTGTRSTEYHITLDMAKELAMVERTPRGREARQYFIACETTLRQHLTQAAQVEAFLLPGYLPWRKQFPEDYFHEVCRVYGLPQPKGDKHSRACMGITWHYIYGALPAAVQETLLTQNPLQPDQRTRARGTGCSRKLQTLKRGRRGVHRH